MKVIVLLTLFGMTLAILSAFYQIKTRCLRISKRVDRAIPSLLGELLPGLVFSFIVLSFVALEFRCPWSYVARMGDNYQIYRILLCEVSTTVQAIIGLILILFLSTLTFGLFAAQVPRRWWLASILAILAWCGIYQFLPFHISAPDFDDFFVVDKFLCALQPTWENDKPFFTIFDYFYRIPDLLITMRTDPFFRFSVNGWIYVLFQINFALMLRRTLATKAIEALGHRGALVAFVLALAYLGPVVLAHGLPYELAGAMFWLLSFNVFETIRNSAKPDRFRIAVVFGWCSLGLIIQGYTTHQISAMWIVIITHAVLVLANMGKLRQNFLVVGLFLSCSILMFPLQNYRAIVNVFDIFRENRVELLLVSGVIVLALILAMRWLYRTGLIKRWLRTMNAEDTTVLVWILYTLAAIMFFIVPNKLTPGIPFPLFPPHWNWGTNHARYSLLFYPFACLFIGLFIFSLNKSVRLRLALLILMAFLWNQAYITGFYFSLSNAKPCKDVLDTGASYQRNTRTYLSMKNLMKTEPKNPLYFIPIPRDHGDHYVLRAVRPQADVSSICRQDSLPTAGRFLLTRHSLTVIEKVLSLNQIPSILKNETPPAFRDVDDLGWEVQILPVETLNQDGLIRWCNLYTRTGFSPNNNEGNSIESLEKIHPLAEIPTQPRKPTKEWIIPRGRENLISEIFNTNDQDLPFFVKNIKIDQGLLTIVVSERGSDCSSKLVGRYGEQADTAGCTDLSGFVLCKTQPHSEASQAVAKYIQWLKSKNLGEQNWLSIWKSVLKKEPVNDTKTPIEIQSESCQGYLESPNSFIYICVMWISMFVLSFACRMLKTIRAKAYFRAAWLAAVTGWALFSLCSILYIQLISRQ